MALRASSVFVLILSSTHITLGLIECFTDYDSRSGTCAVSSRYQTEDSAQSCCAFANIQGFASNLSPIITNTSAITCSPCLSIRSKDAIYCFSRTYDIAQRSCSTLHATMAKNFEECCIDRGFPNNVAEGFAQRLIFINENIPTYQCTPCTEVAARATEWTAWSACSKTCDRGIKQRLLVCNHSTISTRAQCYGEKFESQECNTQACQITPIVLVVIILSVICIIILVSCCILCCYIKRKQTGLKNCHWMSPPSSNINNNEIGRIPSQELDRFHCSEDNYLNQASQNSHYQPNPRDQWKHATERDTDYDSSKSSQSVNYEMQTKKSKATNHPTDCHTYEEIDENGYYVQPEGSYLPMK